MPASAIMKQALQNYLQRFNARDVAGLAALYAEDASLEDPVGTPPLRGRAAILEFYQRAIQSNSTLRLAYPIRSTQGGSAAMAFDVCIPQPQGEMVLHVIDVMAFNDDGLITAMRAYWDPNDMG